MLARTAALSPEYIIESDLGIFENVVTLPEFISAGAVFMYYSFDKEPDTHGLVLRALEDGKTVALPRVLGSGKMEHLRKKDPGSVRRRKNSGCSAGGARLENPA